MLNKKIGMTADPDHVMQLAVAATIDFLEGSIDVARANVNGTTSGIPSKPLSNRPGDLLLHIAEQTPSRPEETEHQDVRRNESSATLQGDNLNMTSV